MNERQQPSGVRILRTDEELRTATERALVFERERVKASADQACRYQLTLERVTSAVPVPVLAQVPAPAQDPASSGANSRVVIHRLPSAGISSDSPELRLLR